MFINQFKPSKFIKKNFMKMIKNPNLFLNKNKRNIQFHFDLMHGEGNLDKATALIDKVIEMILIILLIQKFLLILTTCSFVNQIKF